jgi:hypothetical protein
VENDLNPNPLVINGMRGQNHKDNTKLSIAKLSMVYPALLILTGLIMRWVIPGRRLGYTGFIIALYLFLYAIAFRFSHKFKRLLSRHEEITLFILTSLWTILMELISMLNAVKPNGVLSGRTYSYIFIILLIALIIDIAFIAIGIFFSLRKMICHALGESVG